MLEPGDEIDVWVVDKALGRGGMGSVYRCHNKRAKRILAAVKVLEQSVRASPNAEARFVREAEILFSLDHPNIVKVRNVRMDGAMPFIEMEFVEGESLEDRLNRGPLGMSSVLDLSAQLADAVAYLHDKGIRHRDIKPANVLLRSDGMPKLVDFGIAMEEESSRLTQGGMMFGSVAYAPPEWINPDTLDPSLWDMYALGVVIWEMCTGAVAFPVPDGGSVRQQVMNVMVKKQGHAPLDPGPDFPQGFRDLVGEMTRSEMAERCTDMGAVRDRLAALLEAHGGNNSLLVRRRARPGASETYVPLESDEGMLAAAAVAHASAGSSAVGQTLLPPDLEEPPPPEPPPREFSDSPLSQTLANAPTLPPSLPPPAAEPVQRGLGVAVGLGLGLLAGGVLLAGAAVFLMSSDTPEPSGPTTVVDGAVVPPRDVRLTVTGATLPVSQVQLSGSEAEQIDGAWLVRGVPIGTAHWRIVQGEDCTCGQQCPPTCAELTGTLTVEAGEGAAELSVEAVPAAPRDVRLDVTPKGQAFTATLGGLASSSGQWADAWPGTYELVVSSGSCLEADLGCQTRGDCPDGCSSVRQQVEVEAADGALAVPVSLAQIAASPTQQPMKRSPETSAPTSPTAARVEPETKVAAGSAKLVTAGQFATWLAANPAWQRDAAISAGLADERYLRRWEGDTPPDASAVLVDVSWYAAEAFCKGRGGLAGTGDAPTTWSDTRMPALEFRGKTPALIDNLGTQLPAQGAKANSFAGVRCKR